MKRFALVAMLFAGSVMASEQPPKIIIDCPTNAGKHLLVSQDLQRKELIVNYDDQEHIWVKQTNDMFWNREYNAVEKVNDVEMYANFGKEWVTLAITDQGSNILVTLKVDEGDGKNIEILDSCKSITRLSFGDEVTKDMTWVSNSGEE